jgi:glycine betaine/proline transport system ATP-binding protein
LELRADAAPHPAIDVSRSPQAALSGDVKISCEGIWKIYGPDPAGFLKRHGGRPDFDPLRAEGHIGAVRGVSFSVTTGQILVVMGLSGSGKSTLVRCLSRLVEPTAGSIWFDGEDITRADSRRLTELRRRKIGMVFQNFGLLPHRTASQNVSFPLELKGVPREARQAKAIELLRLVGLEGREGYFPHELSGGQQQRVGIARSLAVEPDLWLLDEPFSALDPLIRREMQDEFIRLQRMLQKTIIFITHDFDEAIRLADQIGIMKDGAIVQLGTPEEIVSNPADRYVEEFTKTAPRGKLISVARAMLPLSPAANPSEQIRGDAKIDDVAARVLESERPVTVVDADGRPSGQLTRQRVIEVLFGSKGAA